MVSTPGVTYRMFRGLADEKINILAISTSEIKLSVVISENDTLKAIKKLHTIFDLDWTWKLDHIEQSTEKKLKR